MLSGEQPAAACTQTRCGQNEWRQSAQVAVCAAGWSQTEHEPLLRPRRSAQRRQKHDLQRAYFDASARGELSVLHH
jgi:hypothetical protein